MTLPSSLRLRMIVLFCAVSCVLLAGASIVFYFLLQTEVSGESDQQLLEIARPILVAITNSSGPEMIDSLNVPGEYFELLDSQDRVVHESLNLKAQLLRFPAPIDRTSPTFQRIYDSRFGWLVVTFLPFQHGNRHFVLAVAIPSRAAQILTDFRQLIVLLVPVGLLFTGVTAAWYVGKSLRPIRDLTRHAAEATSRISDPQRRGAAITLPVQNPADEMGRLALTFNQLFARMHSIVEQMRQFVTDASHELRTPLSILQGETELILSSDRSAGEYRQSLTVLESELKKLSRIVEGLFTLSMADAGELRLAKDALYLNELVETSCQLVLPRATAKNIRILTDVPAEPVPYFGDESFLCQLFIDLLDNAIKYSPASTSIHVRLIRAEDEVRVEFQDEGIGIPEHDQQRIFERFFRVHATSGEGQSGGGLGLAIARAIVSAHNGTIGLSSSVGKGSTFTVSLPKPPDPAAVHDGAPASSDSDSRAIKDLHA